MQEIRTQEQWVLYKLEDFYTTDKIERIKSILDGNTDISLRLIDWFVTNYSKMYNVTFMTKNNRHVNVYLTYKARLKAYSKKMFDPFCRCKRIKFCDIETTVGQLNFFEWAISDEILDYIQKHKDVIHNDMEKRLIRDTKTKKRHELSNSATKTLTRYADKIVINFE